MTKLEQVCAAVRPADAAAIERAKRRWDSIAKPLGSLGLLETYITEIAGLTGTDEVTLNKRAAVVMCADNGVVDEGVTQSGREITAIVAGNIARGEGSVCRMGRVANADVFAVDIGMAESVPEVDDRHIARGTANMTKGPAMTREEAERAVLTGVLIVGELKQRGYDIIATGEMGIGNTTTSSAVASVLLDLPADTVTGRGAGLSDNGLTRKILAIERAIEINRADKNDPLGVLASVGGFDICGMAGMFIGGALYRVPIIIDGFISAAAALAAAAICPECKCAMIASHVSAEPAAFLVLKELGKKPLLCAEMRLGEGTGAVCALPILDMALAEYGGMATFSDIGIDAYKPQR